MASQVSASDLRHAAPPLGLREFWYPAARSEAFGRRPTSIKLLGTDLVFFREQGKVYALLDRCPHRGLPLSCGHRHFAGTISCAYHGWTFDVNGECVAALNEGPGSSLPGKVRVRSYPVEERNGIVWVFMGDGPRKALSEDVTNELLEGSRIINTRVVVWKCGWRPAIENLLDSHEIIVHRRSLFYLLHKLPSWLKVGATETAEGKGIDLRWDARGPVNDVYPVVGRWPRQTWYRRLGFETEKPDNLVLQLRLPGVVRVGFTHMIYLRWTVPIDETTTRMFLFASSAASGWRALRYRLSYRLWMSWTFMRYFVNQDKFVIERQDYSAPERLSQTDAGVIKWRGLVAAAAEHEAQQRAAQTL